MAIGAHEHVVGHVLGKERALITHQVGERDRFDGHPKAQNWLASLTSEAVDLLVGEHAAAAVVPGGPVILGRSRGAPPEVARRPPPSSCGVGQDGARVHRIAGIRRLSGLQNRPWELTPRRVPRGWASPHREGEVGVDGVQGYERAGAAGWVGGHDG